MLFFDQLKKDDPQLRLLSMFVFGGLLVLLAGLWWVQIVKARDYQQNLETQSFRTVRVPAVRGTILDRNRNVLAEDQPNYSVNLYLEDLSNPFAVAGNKEIARVSMERQRQIESQEEALKRKLTRQERRPYALSRAEQSLLRQQARLAVASNVVAQISQDLQQPIPFDGVKFTNHYGTRTVLPFPVLEQLNPVQVARFEEQCSGILGADLEIQSTRFYPNGKTASHVLGYLVFDDSSVKGEEAFFSYRLPDYRGLVGIEGGYDAQLRGHAGAKSVLVNNQGYRQTESYWSPVEPGHNLVLTLDLYIQRAAEASLARLVGPQAHAAIVVMDVHTGDVLALVSSPAIDPNYFVKGFPPDEYARWNDAKLGLQKNRATQENYAPGSIFKPVVGLACLEAGLDPKATIYNPGFIKIGRRTIHDLAPPGIYDFRKAIMFSSNTYFISNGIASAGIENIIRLGQRLHLGERIGLGTRQETPGILPGLARVRSDWSLGDTANICFGQGEIAVTPLQMAVMTAAFANGGDVLFPRLVDRIESQDPASSEPPTVFPTRRVHDQLGVSQKNLQILKDAMRDEVEDAGTGRGAAVQGLKMCGKTGTAQVMNSRNQIIDETTWFISFAPYERPLYAVVVMVESGRSGGLTCAPVAAKIYEAILSRDRTNSIRTAALTQAN